MVRRTVVLVRALALKLVLVLVLLIKRQSQYQYQYQYQYQCQYQYRTSGVPAFTVVGPPKKTNLDFLSFANPQSQKSYGFVCFSCNLIAF